LAPASACPKPKDEPVRVLELATSPAAAYAGLLLGQLGAEVVAVDVGADPLDADIESYVNRGKDRVAVDLSTPSGVRRLLGLVKDADALVEDLGSGGLDARKVSVRRLRRHNPKLVVASISPFGQDGPHADWHASELVTQAMGGMVQSTGWDGEPPVKLAGPMAAFIAGLHAAIAVFAGVFGVNAGAERPAHLDISAQETFLQHWSRHIGQWSYSGAGQRRDQPDLEGQGVPSMAHAADGWICLAVRNARWNTVAGLLGLDDFTGDEWQTPRARVERWSEIAPHFHAAMASRTRDAWFAAAAERGLIFGPVHDLHEVLASEQYAARGYFETLADDARVPGLPFPWEE
jgi:crotonobetainyl-CoA:carnitine CoA-transferase CaiB-like acyl-CoA transferase